MGVAGRRSAAHLEHVTGSGSSTFERVQLVGVGALWVEQVEHQRQGDTPTQQVHYVALARGVQ